jgi:hypothetical protein
MTLYHLLVRVCNYVNDTNPLILCRYPPMTSGEHLLSKYQQMQKGSDSGKKLGHQEVVGEVYRLSAHHSMRL